MTTTSHVSTAYRVAEARKLAARMRKLNEQPSLIARPRALALLARGVDTLATPLAQTLGPRKGFVLNERSRTECEILEDSSTIARRVIRLEGRGNNLGAMMLREMALELHERFGDGVATAAVMVRAMVREASRLVAAGANPVQMVHGIRLAVETASAALAAQARPVVDQEELAALALGVTGDAEMSEILGQIFEVMGESTTVITKEMPRPGLDHEYIRGGKWDGYIPARQLLPEGHSGLILHHPQIILADEDLTTVEQVQPVLELALAAEEKSPLLLLARSISSAALSMLSANHVRGVLTIGMLVLSSGATLVHDDLQDIAALTGGQVFSPLTGSLLRHVRPDSFGHAQQAVLTENGVTIAGGSGSPQAVQQRVTRIRAELKQVSRGKNSEWEYLHLRLARLSGGIGVLKLGASTEQEREIKKEQVGKALRVLEAAYEGGLVPGGGAALLACLPALDEARAACRQEDEISGVALVEAALTAPFLQIVRNHGELHPPLALDRVLRLGTGYGFDALRGDYALMEERRILDCLRIVQGVLEAASSVAAMLITTDTIVFNR
ncbi:MAG TPA: TCP-1/cpn60 chaperonin family protein [Ktedonobacteraceae bacterium]|nr:TCP-1/cpn60 chaperonin family protein [Ktedonobacteraceae bacterium]